MAMTASAAIVVILFAANVTTITNAQQPQQQLLLNNSQLAEVPQSATLFENKEDSFRVQVPEGWVIYDVNNTGAVLAAQVTQGYQILAQLCPEGQQVQQQQQRVSNNTSSSCQQGEIIHIIRYSNLGPRIGITSEAINNTIPDSVLQYEIQKLQEAGYRDMHIINSTDARIKVHYINNTQAQNLGITQPATVPAKLVELTYSTNSAPNEIRRGYLTLTATNATPPNTQTITGYSIFYEGVSAAAAAPEQETTTGTSGSLAPPPAVVRQVFDSFELIPSEEVRLAILQNIVGQLTNTNQAEDAGGEPEDGGDDEANG